MSRARPFLIRRLRFTLRAGLAELIGTFLMVAIGLASGAQYSLLHPVGDHYLSVWVGWGLGVMVGVYVAGGISGAHLNPSVTTSLALHGKFNWKHVPLYILMQITGAFMAAAFVFTFYHPEILRKDPLLQGTQPGTEIYTVGLFVVTRPRHRTNFQDAISEMLATTILIILIFAIGNARNAVRPQYGLEAIAVGASVTGIGAALGSSGGYSLNPARDFGPRVFCALVYGHESWTVDSGYAAIPILAPFAGALLGSIIHQVFCVYDTEEELCKLSEDCDDDFLDHQQEGIGGWIDKYIFSRV